MKLTSDQFRTLRKASEGIIRVTEQMSNLVYDIAYEITALGKESDSITIESYKPCKEIILNEGIITDSVTIASETLQIIKVYSDVKYTDYTYLLSRSLSNRAVLFDTKNEKWGSELQTEDGYLQDPETFYPPTREQKIWFLQHIAEILTAFTNLWEKQERETTDLLKIVKSVIDKLQEDSKK